MGYKRTELDAETFGVAKLHTATVGDAIQKTSAPRSPIVEQVIHLIANGDYENAYGLLKHEGSRDPVLVNAKGVCLLRLGRFAEAADLFRNMVLAPGCTWMRKEIPVIYKLNFATALVLAGHPSGCLDVLAGIGDDKHATVLALRVAIKRWANQLSFWQRLNWWTGRIEPANCHPTIDCTLGEFGFDVGLPPPSTGARTASHQQTAA